MPLPYLPENSIKGRAAETNLQELFLAHAFNAAKQNTEPTAQYMVPQAVGSAFVGSSAHCMGSHNLSLSNARIHQPIASRTPGYFFVGRP